MKDQSYKNLLVNCIASFFIMYGVMFLNVDAADHIYLSLTRLYMSLLMVSPMALLMLLTMRHMFTSSKYNLMVVLTSLFVFGASLWLLRNQVPVSDTQYMKAMIPHHSSAIMTSKNADLKDPEVRALADSIIKSQEKEIAQMKRILNRLQ